MRIESVAKNPHFRFGPEVGDADYHAARKARFERCGGVVAFAALLSRRVPRIAESAILTMRERSRLHRHDDLQKRDTALLRLLPVSSGHFVRVCLVLFDL